MPRDITLIPGMLGRDAVAPVWVPALAIAGTVLTVLLLGVTWLLLDSRIVKERSAAAVLEARRVELQGQAKAVEENLRAYRATMQRATALRDLLAQHITWGSFFRLLETRTLPSVRYESVTADVSGNVTLPAMAPSVRAAAEQLVAWQQTNGVQNIEMSGLASTTDELGVIRNTRFDLRFRVDPSVFSIQY